MTTAENSVSEPPNLKSFPQTPYKARALGTHESFPSPLQKTSYGPGDLVLLPVNVTYVLYQPVSNVTL